MYLIIGSSSPPRPSLTFKVLEQLHHVSDAMVGATARPANSASELTFVRTALAAGVVVAIFPPVAGAYAGLCCWLRCAHGFLFQRSALVYLFGQQRENLVDDPLYAGNQSFDFLSGFRWNVEVIVETLRRFKIIGEIWIASFPA